MVIFQNLYYNSFLNCYQDKKIIAYGTGGTFRDFLKMQAYRIKLLEQIDLLVDRDPAKAGMKIAVGNRELQVCSLDDFMKRDSMADEYVLALFLANEYVESALACLDKIKGLDGMPCIYGLTMLGWGYERFQPPQNGYADFPIPKKVHNIPKIIHYCWFGDALMSMELKDCIRSWKKYCPDYKLKLWNEANIDIAGLPQYVREAYQAEKYAFVSDYVRLKVLFEEGGIYLDTDVMLLKGLEELRKYRSFFSFMEYGEIATGLGFGSIAGTEELREMMMLYEKMSFFLSDGSMNLIPCPRYTNDYFERRGVAANNRLQLIDDMLFLPSSYFAPLMALPCEDGGYNLCLYALEERTIGIHLCENSWKIKEERIPFEKKKEEFRKINQRLLSDWKRNH